MRVATFFLLACFSATAIGAEANPCTNGSFEELTPGGFPADWGPVGQTVEVSSDAHSGGHSVRLVRTADTPSKETGLNRSRLIDLLSGGVVFWYKAPSARGADLNVYVIPVGQDKIEGTGSLRATFTVPEAEVGDGRWHHGRLKYDYTGNPAVKWVHFAARIVGRVPSGRGELLLDDLAYVDHVGAVLRVGAVRLEEDPQSPGRRGTVSAAIENAGDRPARDVRVLLEVPDGLRAEPAEVRLKELAPDAKHRARWTLQGARSEAAKLSIKAVSGEEQVAAPLAIAPKLSIRSFGPAAPVAGCPLAGGGEPITLECLVQNAGTAIVRHPVAEFALPSGPEEARADEIAPGQSVLLSVSFQPAEQTPALAVGVRASAENVPQELTAQTSLVVGSAVRLPPPSGQVRAAVEGDYALLENEHVRLAFRRNAFGFGPGELLCKGKESGPGSWQTVAWLARLSRLVWLAADGSRQEQVVFAAEPPSRSAVSADTVGRAQIGFRWSTRAADGAQWRLAATFELAAHQKSIAARYELSCDRAAKLLAFEGPFVYVLERQEAVFPGLEWLVDDEVSSSSLDIAEDHPDRIRYVVHPNMVTIPAIGIRSGRGTVGLLWDVHQKWDGRRDRPAVAFASPDRFENQRSHMAGVFLPTVPEFVEPNAREAARPYPVTPGRPLTLSASIFADGTSTDVLAAMDAWFGEHGFPQPAPLVHGSYEREIEFSMRAYLDSLWVPDEHQWWTTKGNKALSSEGRPRMFVADLLLGEILSPDAEVRRRSRARADEVLARIGGEPWVDAQRFSAGLAAALANPAQAAGLLAGRDRGGAWRFDADQEGRGPFVGRDYGELGPDDAVELGICARKAFEVLRYARVTGDRRAYDQMQTTLALMEGFRVPRAAQVWEVPVHTPDVLAAADAVDAVIEAYRFGGDARWLADAVTWARRGLPFIYFWDDPEKPFLVGASIPVFGASWYRGSWFGRPVQWNGLRYANAIMTLSEYDRSYPWRQIAETIIRSAIHQQAPDGEDVALWPDNISALDSARCPWVFAPRQILRNILKLTGRDEDPATVILGEGQRRLCVTATAKITDATWDGRVLSFSAMVPEGESGIVLVANVARPAAVLVDGRPLAERNDLETGDRVPACGCGWRYDEAEAYLEIRIAGSSLKNPEKSKEPNRSAVRVEGAAFQSVQRLAWPVERIAFEFRAEENSAEGWMAAHDVARLRSQDGWLTGEVGGVDPYLVRPMLHVAGDAAAVIRLRMRLEGGLPRTAGQLFWTTEASPQFGEDKAIHFAVQADGQSHEYRLTPRTHPQWAGQTITAMRIDPTSGAPGGRFAIDYVRGEKGRD